MNLSINTAQNVSITCKPAGLFNRIVATFIDYLIMGSLFVFLTMIIKHLPIDQKVHSVILVIWFIFLMSYHLIFELVLNGQTPGKMALKLRVIKVDGRKLTFWDCMLRWVLRLVDITTSMGILAMLSIIISSKMQRLGDLAAGTMVIENSKAVSLQHVSHYDVPEDYQVTFPQAALLSDKDIIIIKEILQEVEKSNEYKLLIPLATKVKELTSIQTDMNNLQFIRTVLKDYSHLTQ